jgi:protein-disulfide isomerase
LSAIKQGIAVNRNKTFKSTTTRFMLPVLAVLAAGLVPLQARAQGAGQGTGQGAGQGAPNIPYPPVFVQTMKAAAQNAQAPASAPAPSPAPAPSAAAATPGQPQTLPIPDAKDISQATAYVKNLADINNNPATPAFGNPKGDVVIVEYCDYQSGPCKTSQAGLEKLLKEDGNIKIVYKDYPVTSSVLANTMAFATLASQKQGADGYLKFHQSLLNPQTVVNNDNDLFQVAASAGLDVNQLRRDMLQSNVAVLNRAIGQQIQDNTDVGRSIGVTSVPAFIIGGYLVSGERDYDSLRKMVTYVRSLKTAH